MKRKGELVSKLKPQYQTKTLKQFHFLPLCPTDDEGSGSDVGKKFTKCSTCKYGAECDEDSEDVWWVWRSAGLHAPVFHFLFSPPAPCSLSLSPLAQVYM